MSRPFYQLFSRQEPLQGAFRPFRLSTPHPEPKSPREANVGAANGRGIAPVIANTGKPCGDSHISSSDTCHVGAGDDGVVTSPTGMRSYGVPKGRTTPVHIYHTYESKNGAFDPAKYDFARGAFGLTETIGYDPMKPNEYGDKVAKIELAPQAKVFAADEQQDAIDKLFPKKEAENLKDVWADASDRSVINDIDRKIGEAARAKGYDVLHYTETEQYGDEWAVLSPTAVVVHNQSSSKTPSSLPGNNADPHAEVSHISSMTPDAFLAAYPPGAAVGAQRAAETLGASVRGDAKATHALADAKTKAEREYGEAKTVATREPSESNVNRLQPLAQKVQFFSEALRKANPRMKNTRGVLDYVNSIRTKIDTARDAAADAEPDPQKKDSIKRGHGRYVGTCGHTIQNCRCPGPRATINVDAPCEQCATGVVSNAKTDEHDSDLAASIASIAQSLSAELAPLRSRLEAIAQMDDEETMHEAIQKLRHDMPKMLKTANEQSGTDDALESALSDSFFDGVLDTEGEDKNKHVNYGLFAAGLASLGIGSFLLKGYRREALKLIGDDLEERAGAVSKVLRAETFGTVANFVESLLEDDDADPEAVRKALQEQAQAIDYDPKSDDDDLSDDERVQMTADMADESAYGYGQFKIWRTIDYRREHPVMEFYREEERKNWRPWPSLWLDAGGPPLLDSIASDYPEGAMIAPIDDDIWGNLNQIEPGNPAPPFAWGSGMDVRVMDWREALAAGAIDDDYEPEEMPDRRMNQTLTFHPRISGDLAAQLKDDLGGKYLGMGVDTEPTTNARDISLDDVIANAGKPCGKSHIEAGDVCRIGTSGPGSPMDEHVVRGDYANWKVMAAIKQEAGIFGGAKVDDESVAPAAKAYVMKTLAKDTDIPQEAVDRFVHSWAQSSNDHNPESLVAQHEASKLFGTEMSPWQQKRFDALNKQVVRAQEIEDAGIISTSAIGMVDALSFRDDARELMLSMYKRTQSMFKDAGIKDVVVYRGVTGVKLPGMGKATKVKGNALESWSLSLNVARGFGSRVIGMRVPVRRVLSTPTTGFGCMSEQELVLIGNRKGDKVRVIV